MIWKTKRIWLPLIDALFLKRTYLFQRFLCHKSVADDNDSDSEILNDSNTKDYTNNELRIKMMMMMMMMRYNDNDKNNNNSKWTPPSYS